MWVDEKFFPLQNNWRYLMREANERNEFFLQTFPWRNATLNIFIFQIREWNGWVKRDMRFSTSEAKRMNKFCTHNWVNFLSTYNNPQSINLSLLWSDLSVSKFALWKQFFIQFNILCLFLLILHIPIVFSHFARDFLSVCSDQPLFSVAFIPFDIS